MSAPRRTPRLRRRRPTATPRPDRGAGWHLRAGPADRYRSAVSHRRQQPRSHRTRLEPQLAGAAGVGSDGAHLRRGRIRPGAVPRAEPRPSHRVDRPDRPGHTRRPRGRAARRSGRGNQRQGRQHNEHTSRAAVQHSTPTSRDRTITNEAKGLIERAAPLPSGSELATWPVRTGAAGPSNRAPDPSATSAAERGAAVLGVAAGAVDAAPVGG